MDDTSVLSTRSDLGMHGLYHRYHRHHRHIIICLYYKEILYNPCLDKCNVNNLLIYWMNLLNWMTNTIHYWMRFSTSAEYFQDLKQDDDLCTINFWMS